MQDYFLLEPSKEFLLSNLVTADDFAKGLASHELEYSVK